MRTLPLSAYMALRHAPGRTSQTGPASAARPGGALVWVQCPDPGRLPDVAALACLLRTDGDAVTVLATVPDAEAAAPVAGVVVQSAPVDRPAEVRGFLDNWRPDLLLWLGGALRPVLLGEAGALPIPRLLIDVAADTVLAQGGRWMPGMTRALLRTFDTVVAEDETAAMRLRRAGAGTVRVGGRFEPAAPVLPCAVSDHRDLARALGTRPVWHAADIPPSELDAVLEARQAAGRRAHRLLLILSTPDPDGMMPRLRDAGLIVAARLAGDEPEESTQILLTDSTEPGLWFRLAPVSYMGGTLHGGGARDPFEAAALGSAILHGPTTGAHAVRYGRLVAARASVPAATPAGLVPALDRTMPPDAAAARAFAAWGVISDAAEGSARVTEAIRDALAARGV